MGQKWANGILNLRKDYEDKMNNSQHGGFLIENAYNELERYPDRFRRKNCKLKKVIGRIYFSANYEH